MEKLPLHKSKFCSCCGTAVIYNNEAASCSINITATCDELIKRCSTGEMTVIRGDCPLEMMVGLLAADTVYTIVQFLCCNVCGNTIFWGLCIRGKPIYKTAQAYEVNEWRWENKEKYWLK